MITRHQHRFVKNKYYPYSTEHGMMEMEHILILVKQSDEVFPDLPFKLIKYGMAGKA